MLLKKAMMLVLGIEILLLVAALGISHVSTQLNQNAVDILEKQEKIKKKVGKSRFSRLFLYIFLPVFHIITIRIKDKQIKDTGGILEDESNGNCSADR